MDLISVIVPVYKVEQYLDKCVRSIVDQTYRNLEIILVDDGSPDRCGTMCDAWAEKDGRIKVIHTPNQGSSAARNTALDAAKGELIAFADSDDYMSPEMLAHLHGLMSEEVDIVECDFTLTNDDSAEFVIREDSVSRYDACAAMKEHICDRIFRQVIWNKLYRRSVIGNVRFPVGKKIDDEFFTYAVIGNAVGLIRTESVCYAYRQQQDSIMHTVPVRTWFAGVEAKVLRHEYLLVHFPELSDLSLKSIVSSCLYLNQLAMRTADEKTISEIRTLTRDIFEKYPANRATFSAMTGKERLWLRLAAANMPLTCRIRNLLRIGL